MPAHTEPHVVDAQNVDDAESQALAIADKLPDSIAIRREPTLVLAEAHKAALALHDVISKKPKKVVFNGEQYIENEDWQTIGHFYGITAKIESDSFVQFGDVRGFEATAVALDRAGREVSRAVAMCLNDEENWGPRPKYEWHYVRKSDGKTVADDPGRDEIIWEGPQGKAKPKKLRVRVADEPTPLFQLRSMAQTRACSRVLRQVLGFVPVLAGYRPTPMEELQGAERVDRDSPAEVRSEPVETERRPQSRRAQPPAEVVVDGDLVDHAGKSTAKQTAAPAATTEPAASGATADDTYAVTKVVELTKGTNAQGEWIKYGIETKELGAGVYVSTFNPDLARIAVRSRDKHRVRMLFGTSQNGRFTNRELHEIAVVDVAVPTEKA
jgi:ElaB/YqjD/DUF883 family membrane-anchored ribosome-binding protein